MILKNIKFSFKMFLQFLGNACRDKVYKCFKSICSLYGLKISAFIKIATISLSVFIVGVFANQSVSLAGVGDECEVDSDCNDSLYKCLSPRPNETTSPKICLNATACVSDSQCSTNQCLNISYNAAGVPVEWGDCAPREAYNNEECDNTKLCAPGYACVYVQGLAKSICKANPIKKVLCRMVVYFSNNVAVVFMYFSTGMVGIAFFLGKISWGMILSTILGVGFIYGAEGFVKKATSSSDGFCGLYTAETGTYYCKTPSYEAGDSARDGESGLFLTSDLVLNDTSTSAQYSVDETFKTQCSQELGCAKVECNSISVNSSGVCSVSGTTRTSVNWVQLSSPGSATEQTTKLASYQASYISKFGCSNAPTFVGQQICVYS